MKTKFHFLFIFIFLVFHTASGQKSVSSVTGFNSYVSKDFPKIYLENPPSVMTSESRKNLLKLEHNWLLDSVYQYDWDTTDWTLKTKNLKYYYSNEWLKENLYVVKNPSSGTWGKYAHFLYYYNGSNQDTARVLGEIWTNTSDTLPFQYTHYFKRKQVDTTYTKEWGPVKQKFLSGSQYIYTYDSLDSVTKKLSQRFDTTSNSWKNDYLNTFTYNTNHMPSEEVFQNWNSTSSVWKNINRKVENYDSTNFLIEHIEYIWSDTVWQKSSRITYANDQTGNPMTSLTEMWNDILLTWEPFGQSIFIYSPLGLKFSERKQVYNKMTSQFVDSYFLNYNYFYDNILQSTQGRFWDTINHTWVPDRYSEIDSLFQLSETYIKYHDNTTFEITGGTRVTYTYSPILQTVLNQVWSKNTNDWINKELISDSINPNKLLAQTIDLRWDTTTVAWQNFKLSVYYYSKSSAGINEAGNDKALCNFANPMKTGSIINCPGFTSGAVYYLNIYSLSGALVYSTRFVGGNTVSVSAFIPDGLYIMQFTSGNGGVLSNNKVIILK